MFYVLLRTPLPGVASTLFVFHTQIEAEEFASTIHARHEGAETEEGQAGDPRDLFPEWSW